MVLAAALLRGFGRVRIFFGMFGHYFTLFPGILATICAAFYKMTLEECALESHISFGSFFAHPEARRGERAYLRKRFKFFCA